MNARAALIAAGTLAAFFAAAASPAAAGTPPSDTVATEKFSTARTEYFVISAETPEAANRVAALARETENYFLRTPKLWKKLLPPTGTRVEIELFSRAGIFSAGQNADGRVVVYVSENPDPDGNAERALRRCLAGALMRQMLVSSGARDCAVPAWMEAAVAEESRVGNVPGRRIFLRKRSEKTPPVRLLTLLGAPEEKFEADEAFRLGAVWLLRSVPGVSVFFDTKKTADQKVAAAFPRLAAKGKLDASAAELFWATRYFSAVAGAPAGVDLPAESRNFFDEALLFPAERNGEDVRLLAGDLVAFRADAKMRKLVAERFAAFVARFRSVNPVWHNAFAEYGVFLEMFGNPDVPDETLAAQWEKTVFARAQALALEADVRAALGETEARERGE